ncbi:MAG TPA: hypothetical protein VF498_11150 [Anaerolineales bacterium]
METLPEEPNQAEVINQPETVGAKLQPPEITPGLHSRRIQGIRKNLRAYWALLALITYIVGLGSGYFVWGRSGGSQNSDQANAYSQRDEMVRQINPPDGYKIPAVYGDFGPKLIASGAIDETQFLKIYQDRGQPISQELVGILEKGSSQPVVINSENQGFLLNLFWALGLANQNPVLTQGPMLQNGKDNVVNFASTGGWTLATRPIPEIYASAKILTLTAEQQARLEEVAQGVYRPCCDNATYFPDCNHGMAMLGMLELMASQNASVDQMFAAAKYFNAYWFPQQTLELAVLLKSVENTDFTNADGRTLVGKNLSSVSGFQAVHQYLSQNGKLEQVPKSGGNCGV